MNKFGFQISTTRSIDLDTADLTAAERLLEAEPSLKACIGCGGCTATCTAADFVDFNIRLMHTAFVRGQQEGLRNQLGRCMLCGKCLLVCPRGVHTRSVIMAMRKELTPEEK